MKKMNKRERIAYDFIKTKIEIAQWPKGNQLKELELSRQLNLSRTPIRRALDRLLEEGYVYRVPNKGVFVGEKPLGLSQQKERLYFLEALLQHILYALQLDECVVDTEPLSKKIAELESVESLTSNQFEVIEIDFWRGILNHHSNTYMNEQVLEAMVSLYQEENQGAMILKKSRTIKVSHYQKLVEWLKDTNYPYARREIRLVLNQLLINLIQGIDD